MTAPYVVTTADGTPFVDGIDRVRIIVFGHETGGRYSLMEWIIGAAPPPVAPVDYGIHRHMDSEETFLIRRGTLDFYIADRVVTLSEGDFVRVPPGIRHGYANVSGAEVDMLVGFIPGGMEELFLRYRTDIPDPLDPATFAAAALAEHATVQG